MVAAQAATRRSVAATRAPSRVGLRSPPSHSRAGAASQRQRLPDPPLADLDADLVGLHLAHLDLPRLHHRRMHLRCVGPRAVQPRRHRALVQPEGGHDGLRRAAMAHQSHHQHQQLHRVAHPVEGRPPRRRECAPTGLAPVALLLLTVDATGPVPLLPLVRAGQVRATCSGRVHACSVPGRVSETRLLVACRMRPVPVTIARPPRLSGVVPARPHGRENRHRDVVACHHGGGGGDPGRMAARAVAIGHWVVPEARVLC